MRNNLWQRIINLAWICLLLSACGGEQEGREGSWVVSEGNSVKLKDFNNVENFQPQTCTVEGGGLIERDGEVSIAGVGTGTEFSEVDGSCSGALSKFELEALIASGVLSPYYVDVKISSPTPDIWVTPASPERE